MRIAVTGASGFLGRAVVADLRRAGHEVRGIDRRSTNGLAPDLHADTGDLGQMCGALHGCDGVVHLAAIPSLHGQAPDVVFTTNVLGTFNVLEAAALQGVRRVVTASSASALGWAYRYHDFAPLYFPIDEDHPLLPQDAYGLSKQVGEQICSAFHRRTGGSAISLRFPWIWDLENEAEQYSVMWRNDEAALHTLYTYVDVRDAAVACRLALETKGLTDEAFYIAAPSTFMPQPSSELAQRFFPQTEIHGDLERHWAFISSARAEQVLGFRANYSVSST